MPPNSLQSLVERKQLILARSLWGHFQSGENLSNVLAELSKFFDETIQVTWTRLAAERDLDVENGGVAVFALGKLGSQEVNFDSDLDLVFLRLGNLKEHQQRQWEQLIRLMVRDFSTETSSGHLPLIDLNLRPYGASGPLLPSVELAQKYYWNSTDLWNRLAWMRGRFVCGDSRVRDELDEWIFSYVYPKYLDFRLIEQLNELHRKLLALGEVHGATSWNVKYGRGGIRELEFIVQGQVLVHGGRRPEGRSGNIFSGFDYLQKWKILNPDDLEKLRTHYDVLRTLEHLAQFIAGTRTYQLEGSALEHPLTKEALRLKEVSGLGVLFDQTHQIFEKTIVPLLNPAKEELDLKWNASSGLLEKLQPYLNEKQTQRWTLEAKNRFRDLIPLLLKTVQNFSNSHYVLDQFLLWVDKLKIRGGYFQLLIQHPPLLQRLLQVLSLNSPLLNEWLAKPRLIENILLSQWDGKTQFQGFWGQWKQSLNQTKLEPSARSHETLEELRDCRATYALEIVGQHLSHPSEWRDLQKLWNQVPEQLLQTTLSEMAGTPSFPKLESGATALHWILMGSFGGGTADLYSDLDLLILVSDEFSKEKPELSKFCQRVTQSLSLRTPKGVLFPVDLRLRPSGTQGPLIVTESYFLKYAIQEGRLWEWLSWFRGREIACVDGTGRVTEGDRFDSHIKSALLEALHSRKKTFTSEDQKQLLATLEAHRKQDPLEVKWKEDGLIEMEIRARIEGWAKGDMTADTEALCRKHLKKPEQGLIEENLWVSWHHRLFPFQARPPSDSRFHHDLAQFIHSRLSAAS